MQKEKNKDPKTFGETIYKYRTQKGISLRSFAKSIGISPSFLSELENDKTSGTAKEETIKKIANKLELNFEKLMALAKKVPEKELTKRQENALKFFRRELNNNEKNTKK